MAKQLIIGEESRNKLIAGALKLAKAVEVTLGPSGNNVVIARKMHNPIITKDGISVARQVKLEDEVEDMGAQILLEVSSRTNELAGDGTTSSVVIASNILKWAVNHPSELNPIKFKNKLDEEMTRVLKVLQEGKSMSCDDEQLESVIFNSTNGDKDITGKVLSAVKHSGLSGIIMVEKGYGQDVVIKQTGMSLSTGWLLQESVTNLQRLTVEYKDAHIALLDNEIEDMDVINNILKLAINHQAKNLVIYATEFSEDIEASVHQLLVSGELQKQFGLKLCLMRASAYGIRRSDIMEDIGIHCGCTVFKKGQAGTLGCLDSFIAERNSCSFTGVEADSDKVKARVELLRHLLENESSNYTIDTYRERIAGLTGGAVIIRVGGQTEFEMRERKDRFDDAVCAARSAMEEGLVPGGGWTYHILATHLEQDKPEAGTAAYILAKALKAIVGTIFTNAGFDRPTTEPINLNEQLMTISFNHDVQNLNTGEISKIPADVGLIDPAKVIRVAIENAVSVAGLLLTTRAVIGYDKTPEIKV